MVKRMQGKEANLDQIGPKIAVIGVGGAGGNAVDNMIRSGSLSGVAFLVCNTDAQALSQSLCPESQRVRLGFGVTQGLGAGSSPDVGRAAAEESIEEVMRYLEGVHMVFITAGMGGGTGTGGAPVIAHAAKSRGILTVGVVTKPFQFEGGHRMRVAEKGIETIRECVDTLLVIPNQNLFRIATETTTFAQAFALADDVLCSGVRTFTDLMIKPGIVNLDFADICAVMRNMEGKAMMGTGEATGENRAIVAAERSIGCPLLDDIPMQGAQSLLINVSGSNLTLFDVDEAIGRIKQEVEYNQPGRDTRIIFGATFDSEVEGIRVSVVATGIRSVTAAQEEKVMVKEAPPLEEPVAAPAAAYHTLGSRHGDYAFDEKHFSSFSLQEEQEEFVYTEVKPEVVRKRSFFERLTGLGRRKEGRGPSYGGDSDKMDKPVLKSFYGNPEGPGDKTKFPPHHPHQGAGPSGPLMPNAELEIPSFLRQKQRRPKV